MQGTTEECQWIYIVNFYQQTFNKIKHPLFKKDSTDGTHEINLFADAKILLVSSADKIMWAPFKFEEQRETITQTPQGNKSNKNSSLDDSQTSFTQRVG